MLLCDPFQGAAKCQACRHPHVREQDQRP